VDLEKRVTLRDVAKEAGVSASMVSHVLHNYPAIREETRRKVWAASAKLGYKPNLQARQLRAGVSGAGRTRNLALVIVETDPPYAIYMPMINTFSRELLQRDLHPLVLSLPTEIGSVGELPACLRDRSVDGFLLMGELSRDTMGLFDSLALPYVVVGNEGADSNRTLIQPDVATATREAVQRLFEMGHKDIGLVSERFVSGYSQMILFAFRQAYRERELDLKPEWIQSSGRRLEGGIEPMKRMLALSNRPTALLFTNIRIAANAYGLAREHGLEIPGDLSMVAFSATGEREAQVPVDRLVVDYPMLGTLAVKLLLEKIEDPAHPRLTVNLPCRYQEHGSCGVRTESGAAGVFMDSPLTFREER